MTKRKKWLSIGLVLAAIVLFVYIRHGNKPALNETVTIKRGNIAEKVIAVGSIVPRHTISVKSTISGTVGQLFHEEGDYVDEGALLLQVTPAPTPESIAEAYEAVKENQATLDQTESHRKRLAQLIKLQLETPDNYAMAKKEVKTAEARLEMSQQKLNLIQKGETVIGGKAIKTMIMSPISGYILQRNVDAGDPVVPLTDAQEGTVLLVIANMHDLIFKGTVNEIDVEKIGPGMKADIAIAALPDAKIEGDLRKVDLQANQESGTSTSSPFNVGFNVELTNLTIKENIKLRAGYSATAEITVKKANNVLIIPERLLIFKDNKIYVNRFLAKNKKPLLQEIKIGLTDGINAEVISGLKENDKVLDANTHDAA